LAENLAGKASRDTDVVTSFDAPLKAGAGLAVLSGNLFDSAIMKVSVISDAFRKRYLSDPDDPDAFEARAVVFEGSEDYHARINDPQLQIDEQCILVIRGAGPIGWPGAAEVVNMQPPDALLKRGITSLPTLGDGRQSGTADSPSIVHASPESASGGGLSKLRTGDIIRIDIGKKRCDVKILPEDWMSRTSSAADVPADQTPWQRLYRATVGPLSDGAIIEGAEQFGNLAENLPRHNH
jgi:dihydroxy-acid dehydratase